MHGTSTEVATIVGGEPQRTTGGQIDGLPIGLPTLDIHTGGAGGGSVAWLDAGGALRVGPRSAGAVPGPAAYGRGGTEPTGTDANLILGYLDASSPLAGGVELDGEAAERALRSLGDRAGLSLEDVAAGIVRVASAEMARAVRVMTVERGIDPRQLALVPFGGAGPLHAAAIADELGMTRIVVPQASGVLSALGLLVSERRRDMAESVLLRGEALTKEAIASTVERLAEQGRADLGLGDTAEVRASYDLGYVCQAFELTVHGSGLPEPDALRQAFNTVHQDHYGFYDDVAELELVTVRVAVAEPGAEPRLADPQSAAETSMRSAWFDGERLDARVVSGIADRIDGPAIAELPGATLVIPSGWHAEHAGAGTLVMERD